MNFRSKWSQTSLIFILLCSRYITIIIRQIILENKKIKIILVWNHFNLKHKHMDGDNTTDWQQ